MDEEKLTSIIGFRVYPSWKKYLIEESKKRNMRLSDFTLSCIEKGMNQIVNNVEQETKNV